MFLKLCEHHFLCSITGLEPLHHFTPIIKGGGWVFIIFPKKEEVQIFSHKKGGVGKVGGVLKMGYHLFSH